MILEEQNIRIQGRFVKHQVKTEAEIGDGRTEVWIALVSTREGEAGSRLPEWRRSSLPLEMTIIVMSESNSKRCFFGADKCISTHGEVRKRTVVLQRVERCSLVPNWSDNQM